MEKAQILEASYNILIIGGGIVGSSIAMALAEAGAKDIAVVDSDLSGTWGSSERNAGGVRATWSQPVNIALSKDAIAFYEQHAAEVGFHQQGYLWLYDEAGWRRGKAHRKTQAALGGVLEPLFPQEITKRFPFLDRLEGVYRAGFSPKDGLINPNLLKSYYRRRASAAGVTWIDRHAVEKITVKEKSVRRLHLREISSEDALRDFLITQKLAAESPVSTVEVKTLVNAAGAWAPRLSSLYGQKTPSTALRRQVSILHAQDLDLSAYGMIVDNSGLYFHHEGGNILAGYALPAEPPGYRLDYDRDSFFIQEIWPRLAKRSSNFDRLKPIGGWAGLYAVSPDSSAIIGQVDGFLNLYEAHAFSGHGVMQSYAVGRGLAELILEGRYRSIDLSMLSGHRFKTGKTVSETMLI